MKVSFDIPDEMVGDYLRLCIDSAVKKFCSDDQILAKADYVVREIIREKKDEIVGTAVEGAINSITLRVAKHDLYKKFLEENNL